MRGQEQREDEKDVKAGGRQREGGGASQAYSPLYPPDEGEKEEEHRDRGLAHRVEAHGDEHQALVREANV